MSLKKTVLRLCAAVCRSFSQVRLNSYRLHSRLPSNQRGRRTKGWDYQPLESRELLAAIIFDSATGNVTVAGDANDNVGAVTAIGGSQLRFSVDGVADRTFTTSQVTRVTFIGFGGNDQFTNNSSEPSFQYGGDGNDTLIGGSAADDLIGGRGNDTAQGRSGADRIVGGDGNDTLNGNDGADRIFGSSGINTITGDDGADVIYGGDQIDTIYGGNDADQIFGLGGDDVIDSGNGGVIGGGIAAADLVLGLGGDDRITGGTGLNVFWGGDGNDTLTGTDNAENRLHGQDGRDTLIGGNLGDYLSGGDGADVISGNAGNDFIRSSGGDELVNGGAGTDTAIYADSNRQYRINGSAATTLTVRDMRDNTANEGTDSLAGFERLRFADGDRDAVSPIIERVVVRPIITADNNGSRVATFFGDATQEKEIKALIDDIFYQANVDVFWEADRQWNNTFANRGNGGTRPTADLNTIVTNGDNVGRGSSDVNVIDAYFVQIAAGFGQTSDNTANGLAFIGQSGTTIHVGDNLLTSQSGRRVAARVVAHELAHNLGLNHVNATNNLMDDGRNLNSTQIQMVLNSTISQPV